MAAGTCFCKSHWQLGRHGTNSDSSSRFTEKEAPTNPAERLARGHTSGTQSPSLFLVTHTVANIVMLTILYVHVSYLPQWDDERGEGEGNVTGLLPPPPAQSCTQQGISVCC